MYDLLHGDCRDVMLAMPAGSVQCVVTSPPYWQKRLYPIPTSIFGGDSACGHDWQLHYTPRRCNRQFRPVRGQLAREGRRPNSTKMGTPSFLCGKCGAWRGHLGWEKEPERFVEHLVSIFHGVRRLLTPTGQVWVNLDDTRTEQRQWALVPEMFVLAMVRDGWRIEDTIIWHKTNATPSPGGCRTTRAHELFFLFNTSRKAYWNADAIREPHTYPEKRSERVLYDGKTPETSTFYPPNPLGKNKSSVWTIPKGAYDGLHLATYPPRLIEPCILATTRPGDTVLDIFCGSGVTVALAEFHGRHGIGIDASAEYLRMAAERVKKAAVQPGLWAGGGE